MELPGDKIKSRRSRKIYLVTNNIDIACICETFLKPNQKFVMGEFKCIRIDRTIGRLGGLAILVNKSIEYKEIAVPNTNLLECMGIEIQCNNKSLKVMNVYLPGGASDQLINQNYENDLLNITNLNDPYIIVGDLNSKHTDWNCDVSNVAGNILKRTSDNSNFFIDWPPHHTYCPMSVHKSHATIDLILTNYKIPINSISTRSQFS